MHDKQSIITDKADKAKESLMNAVTGVRTLRDIQRLYIEFVLANFGGNKCHAAKALGINRRTIQRMASSGRVHGAIRPKPIPQAPETLPYPIVSSP